MSYLKRTIKIVAFGCAAAVAGYVAYRAITEQACTISRVQEHLSEVLEQDADRYEKSESLRSKFTDLTVVQARAVSSHTHGVAAANRSSGSIFIDRLGAVTGETPYYVQRSRQDERNVRQGSRCYYWAKDLGTSNQPFIPPADALLALVDVDHYIDMPRLLCQEFKPVILYTFQPTQVARVSVDYAYTFQADSSIKYTVPGGGVYEHFIWNYGTDHVIVQRSIFGIPYQVAIFLIDRHAADEDHELVMLTPVIRWTGYKAIIASYTLSGRRLDRLDVVDGDFSRMEIHRKGQVLRSTGRLGEYNQATIPAAVDASISVVARNSKVGLTYPQVQSYVDGDKEKAAPLFEYHMTKSVKPIDLVFPVEDSVRRYQFGSEFDPNAKPSLKAFMSPVVHGAFAPDRCESNEHQAIVARVEDVRSVVEITPALLRFMHEFETLFLPLEHTLDPVDDDELYDRQSNPSQRRILREAEFTHDPRKIVKSFVKAEAYADAKDPRVISTLPGAIKAAYSKYIYTLAEVIKLQHWYAFGHAPVRVAERVVEVLSHANCATNTDLSRCDGRMSNFFREFENRILVRAFRPVYHKQILDLHRSQFNCLAVCSFGTKYDTGTSRLSGSPETAAFNSLANAFIAYVAIRMTMIGSSYPEPQEAYDSLGIYGGDDGLTADVDSKKYVEAATMVGQKLTVEVVKRGDAGIKFLARLYGPDVWFGDTSSCCDVARQIAKFHTTTVLRPGVTPVDKLCEKAYAYYLSDRNTPILGEIANRVVALGYRKPVQDNLKIWGADLPEEIQYPNEPRDWYVEEVRRQMPSFDYERFRGWLRNSNTIEDLLAPPLCMEIIPAKSDVQVVVDGEVIKGRKPSRPSRAQSAAKADKVKVSDPDVSHENVRGAPKRRSPRNSLPPLSGWKARIYGPGLSQPPKGGAARHRRYDDDGARVRRPDPWQDPSVKGPAKPWVRADK